MRKRAVITGIGPVTTIGIGKDALWSGLLREKSAIRRVPAVNHPLSAILPAHACHAAWIDDFTPSDWFPPHRLKRLDRYVQFSLAASRLALLDSGLLSVIRHSSFLIPHSARAGVSFGTGLGGIAHAEMQHTAFLEHGIRGITPALAFQIWGGSAHSNIAIEHGLQGPATTNSNSCASGNVALMDAARFIVDGTADVMIAGAAECPLAPLTFAAFDHIHTMSRWTGEPPEHACRPFHRDRDGFVMAEGAAAFVVEEYEHAVKRGARIYAEITGWSLTNEAHHMTSPRPDGAPLRAAIQTALDSARLQPDQISYINAHGSSTPANDVHECQQLAQVFGNAIKGIPISGTKAFTGHTLGAAGAIEAAVCLLAMQNNWLPPTLHLTDPDPALADFDLVPLHARESQLDHILSNSFGFGGIDSCIVLSRV
jgi:3-oxoacyl-[acyl-carrier-protein] synthase II